MYVTSLCPKMNKYESGSQGRFWSQGYLHIFALKKMTQDKADATGLNQETQIHHLLACPRWPEGLFP